MAYNVEDSLQLQESHVARVSFLRMPAEIRIMIYRFLILPSPESNTVSIRTKSFSALDCKPNSVRSRSTYRIMGDRSRARSVKTTYNCVDGPKLWTSLLSVNRQIHAEASYILYSGHVFDFGTDIESIIPFMGDLTLISRASIKRINIVKRALPYDKDFDRCEWYNVCEFLSNNMNLVELGLGVLGGKSGAQVTEREVYSKSDFAYAISKFEGMEWMTQLATIKGLQQLDIKAHLQHCPPPCSNAMAFFVNFSQSIEFGFAEYMRELMII